MKISIYRPKKWVLLSYLTGALCIGGAMLAHFYATDYLSTVFIQRLFIVGGIVVCIASIANTYYFIRRK